MPDDPAEPPAPWPDLLAAPPAAPPRRRRRAPPLFRAVEVAMASNGRLVRHGQIWHADLDHVRRFGRALAANSVSQMVLVTDAAGAVIERIPVSASATPAGWSGWRDLPLPPAPPRTRQRSVAARLAALAAPAEPAVPAPPIDGATVTPAALPATRKGPPKDLPVVQSELPATGTDLRPRG